MRLRAPLQQKRGEEMNPELLSHERDKSGGLPPLVKQFGRDCFGHAGTDRGREAREAHYQSRMLKKKALVVPGAAQVERASRLMQGYSCCKDRHSATRSAPATLYPGYVQAREKLKDSVAYGMAYRQKLTQKQSEPTYQLKQVTIGLDMGAFKHT